MPELPGAVSGPPPEAWHGRFFVKSALWAVGARVTLEFAGSVRGTAASEERPGWQ
ncbi:hypothetical protein ACGFYY_42185 [Streptomyces sp. NPDC048331]|uniref:hypothetical protein n=1 Tax=Streptomyces sp. NPDC048331 TaxID=3365534 RepID=UPI0037215050